jgi:hypothetical protein
MGRHGKYKKLLLIKHIISVAIRTKNLLHASGTFGRFNAVGLRLEPILITLFLIYMPFLWFPINIFKMKPGFEN